MPKISERKRIQALEAKLKQLKTLEARKAARARTTAAKKSRGEELRRKILAGAVLLAKVEAGEFEEAVLKQWMSVALTREEDRALFGLALRAPLVGSVPLGEELLFRGLLLDWLKQKVAAWQAVPISSLIFALLHNNHLTMGLAGGIELLDRVSMGVGASILSLRGHSLRGPFLMHAANNLVACIADALDF